MKNNVRSNDYQSLCEMSLQVAANMIKLSSFSIAKLSLGIGGTPTSTMYSASLTAPDAVSTDNHLRLHPQFPGGSSSSRSQVTESSSKPIIYLIEPNTGAGLSYMVREDTGVDGKASEYIRKVHEQYQSVSDEASSSSTLPPFLLPSPLRVVK